MSDREVQEVLDSLEAWLEGGPDLHSHEELGLLMEAFHMACLDAERGPGWAGLVARAQELGQRFEGQAIALLPVRDAMKQELGMQAVGTRALKAYRPSGH